MTLPPMPSPAGNPGMRTAGGATRTLLITGVSRGLGKALALELAKRGHIIIGCSRSQDKLNAFQIELASATNPPSENKHFLMNVDVSLNSSVEEFARAVMEKKGVPDIIGVIILKMIIKFLSIEGAYWFWFLLREESKTSSFDFS